ncbi:MAG TPA: ABC transporter permease subunit [Gaiellales bacterium]|nr:ABC transporter permease subunit [Gaiellales bacterium]
MTAQLRAELLKVRSTRTTIGLVLGMVALVLLFIVLTTSLTGAREISSVDDQIGVFAIGSFSGLFSALAGILLVTGEFRFGTIRPTLLFTPRRDRVIGSKAAAAFVAGLVFGVLGAALAVGVGAAILSGRGIEITPSGSDFALLALGTVAGAALWGAIGVGLGAVVRNQVGAIIGLLAWGFVIENLLFALAPSEGRFTPGEAQNALMGQGDAHLLDPLPAAAVLVAWTVAAAVAGAVMTMRRDVD